MRITVFMADSSAASVMQEDIVIQNIQEPSQT